jgi:hypothetical protein
MIARVQAAMRSQRGWEALRGSRKAQVGAQGAQVESSMPGPRKGVGASRVRVSIEPWRPGIVRLINMGSAWRAGRVGGLRAMACGASAGSTLNYLCCWVTLYGVMRGRPEVERDSRRSQADFGGAFERLCAPITGQAQPWSAGYQTALQLVTQERVRHPSTRQSTCS